MSDKTDNLLLGNEFKDLDLKDLELPRYVCEKGETECQKANSHNSKQY